MLPADMVGQWGMGSLVTVTLAQHDSVREGLAQLCLQRTAFLLVGRGCRVQMASHLYAGLQHLPELLL